MSGRVDLVPIAAVLEPVELALEAVHTGSAYAQIDALLGVLELAAAGDPFAREASRIVLEAYAQPRRRDEVTP
jgi:hypothetical protein